MNPISRTVLTLVGAAALAAHAQESPSGFYLGGALGAAKAKSEATVALSGSWTSESSALRSHVVSAWGKTLEKTGVLFGLQGGYRHALGSGWTLDTELTLALMSGKEELATGPVVVPSTPSLNYALTTSVAVKHALSLDAKIGYQVGAHMPFLTLGYTSAKTEATQQIISNGNYRKAGSASSYKGGFQWGVGYGFQFNRQWSGSAAVTTAKLGDLTYDTTYLPGSAFTSPAYGEAFTHKLNLTTFKVAVNYHF